MKRRRFLRSASIAATVAITGVAGCTTSDGGGGGTETGSPGETPTETSTGTPTETPANETTTTTTGNGGAQQVAAHYKFGGKVAGWQAREPQRIADAVNPTLDFEAGQTYKVTWENLDGAPHNVAVLDSQGNVVHETEIISEQGATQTTRFTATDEMAEYLCQIHPNTMRGQIQMGGG